MKVVLIVNPYASAVSEAGVRAVEGLVGSRAFRSGVCVEGTTGPGPAIGAVGAC